MKYTTLRLERTADGIAFLWLNRPEVKNAMNGTMFDEGLATVEEIEKDPAIRVVVLAGAGSAFCAGADIRYQQQQQNRNHEERAYEATRLARWLNALDLLSKPLVGSVHGLAYGGGIGLTAVCDLVVSADDMRFSVSEVTLGVMPSLVSPYIVRKIGVSHARAVFLNAEPFDAAAAAAMGLVHRVVSADRLAHATQEEARRFLRGAPAAIAGTKRLIAWVAQHGHADNLQYTQDRVPEMWTSAAAQEGMAAFLEKRKPSWRVD